MEADVRDDDDPDRWLSDKAVDLMLALAHLAIFGFAVGLALKALFQ